MPGDLRRAFFDSNTLLYLISSDAEKSRRMETCLLDRGCISVQVLNEFANIARRKHRMVIGQIRPLLLELRQAVDVVPLTVAIHETGLDLAERYGFSTYDAMIIAAALDCGCDRVLSEDMHHGMIVESRLEIRNPFI